jgi:hypothetical protein
MAMTASCNSCKGCCSAEQYCAAEQYCQGILRSKTAEQYCQAILPRILAEQYCAGTKIVDGEDPAPVKPGSGDDRPKSASGAFRTASSIFVSLVFCARADFGAMDALGLLVLLQAVTAAAAAPAAVAASSVVPAPAARSLMAGITPPAPVPRLHAVYVALSNETAANSEQW